VSKKDRRSRDQKRKAKLAKEARKHPASAAPIPYTGSKYKKDEFTPLTFRTEIGIHEADVMTGRKLTDHDVRASLEQLIETVRKEGVPPPDYRDEVAHVQGKETDLVYWNIRRNWEILFEEMPNWGADDIVGVLRTLLGSIAVWGSPSAQSRGYLQFLEGFMKKAGVGVRALTAESEELAQPEEDPMLELGRDWCEDGDEEAADAFRHLADQRIRAGEAEQVVDVCQQLIGEIGMTAPEIMRELSSLSIQAQRAMQKRLT
jgi:hypothetical protein